MIQKAKRIISNILSSIITTFIVLFGFFAIIYSIFNFSYIKTQVVGFSMLPTYNATVPDSVTYGDTVYINRFRTLENNTIIVATVEWNEDPIIKRLVGMPGDIIEIKDENNVYNLYVNNEIILTKEKTDESLDGRPRGTNQYYLQYLSYLTVFENGKTYIDLAENEYFIMGDNWGGTDDSFTHGVIKKENIIGTIDAVEEYQKEDKHFFIKFIFQKIFKI